MCFKKWFMVLVAGLALSGASVFAADDEIEKSEQEASADKKGSYVDALKTKYSLTDEQIKSMQDKGYNDPQMAIIAGLSKASGKSLDEVMKMRSEQKMGWGKIAKTLGVPPREIGQSVSGMHHDVNEARFAEKHGDKMQAKADKAAERAEKKEQRKADHAQKKADHAEKAHGH